MSGRCARGRLWHPCARRSCPRRRRMYDRSSGAIRTVQCGTRSESSAGRGAADGCRDHGRGAPQSRSRCLDRRDRASDYGGHAWSWKRRAMFLLVGPSGRADLLHGISTATERAIVSTGVPRRLSSRRTDDSRSTKQKRSSGTETARDRRRCRLGSVRDGGGRGFDRRHRFDVARAGWRQPAHRLWGLRGQSEWCCVDDGNRRRHHPPCNRQEYLRSSSVWGRVLRSPLDRCCVCWCLGSMGRLGP